MVGRAGLGNGRLTGLRGRDAAAVSELLYLGVALVLSVIGGTVIYLRNRKPTSLNAGIEEFQRELRALAPEKRRSGMPGVGGLDDAGRTTDGPK